MFEKIADEFSISKPAISEHLKILRTADLIYSEKKGQYVEYSLNTSIFQEIISFFFDIVPDQTKPENSRKGGKNEASKEV